MIAVIGDLLLDIFILSELQEAEQGEGIVLRGGGSAANTACWVAALGEPVTFVGCTGDDPRGIMLARELRDRGVTPWVRAIPRSETGAVAIEVSDSGER